MKQSADLTEDQLLAKMGVIMRNNHRFSENEDDESSIFVEPYLNNYHKVEKRTKTTLSLLVTEK